MYKGEQIVPRGQNRVILTGVVYRSSKIADALVEMSYAVSTHEASSPESCLGQIDKVINRELRALLGRAIQRVGVGVTSGWPPVRSLFSQQDTHRQCSLKLPL